MTRKQAIREIDDLDYYLQHHTDDYSESSHTAMMMAISALEQEPSSSENPNKCDKPPCKMWSIKDVAKCFEKHGIIEQEPCDDAISRHKAIVMITAYEGKSAQIEALEQLPSVQPSLPKPENPEYCEGCIHDEVCGFFGTEGCAFKDVR